ncbi:MAG TPA: rhomboid family intramembrane serine protease, partial [Planctomycetota bacterium]|nr:rhomboid family intramembrane serine protease [Planctomycetota bacterium]
MRFRRPYIIEAARRRRPAVWVYILSAVLAALWLVPQALDRRVDAGEDLIGEKLFEVFAHDPAAVWSGEYWRLLTATFLHGNFLHLAFNVFGLMILGPAVERWLGGMRFL